VLKFNPAATLKIIEIDEAKQHKHKQLHLI
jgi:hypothetical protein